jgi:transglutaminase-like putative cysteine protease
MQRTVSSRLDLLVTGQTRIVTSIAVARDVPVTFESLAVTVDGEPVEARELEADHGTRLHVADVAGGEVRLAYEAVVDGLAAPATVSEVDAIRYLRPSRYCESDSLAPTAAAEFAGREGLDLLQAVTDWVHTQLAYVTGSSLPTDGAVRTLLARQGVCRDFAHLSIALLRSLNVPARLAAVYAPGLSPMEFHAVCEAAVEGQWWVVDPTELAPRQSLVRIATGQDAADTAFLTTFGGSVQLSALEVTAVTSDFELDDTSALTRLR